MSGCDQCGGKLERNNKFVCISCLLGFMQKSNNASTYLISFNTTWVIAQPVAFSNINSCTSMADINTTFPCCSLSSRIDAAINAKMIPYHLIINLVQISRREHTIQLSFRRAP